MMKINALLAWVAAFSKKKQNAPTSLFTETKTLYFHNNTFNEFDAVSQVTVSVKVPYKNIECYTKRLIQFTDTIEKNRGVKLTPEDCDLFQVSIGSFFTSEDNYYVNQNEAYQKLREVVIGFCHALTLTKTTEDDTIVLEHNQRVLSGIVSNLKSLSLVFHSNQNQP